MGFLKTGHNRVSLSGLLAGLRETRKIKGKRISLWLEHKTAIHVAVEDKTGKVILKDSFRYVGTARARFDELALVIA